MPPEPTSKSKPGVRIGRYEVLSHIATGGMGAVYKARDVDLGRVVALKILAPELAARPGNLERFRREARSAAQLRHENIVAIYECGESGGNHFLALEFVDGTDLHDYITQRKKLDPEEARQIMLQAARALDHAHQQHIVHRDIKPSNFLLTRNKEGHILVKLTDMGLARQMREDEFRVTRAGTTVGTVDYMAPEQARDSAKADIRSDIYSLGCTFYHMLGGRAPFPEGSLTERIYQHVEADPTDIRKLNPGVSEGLAAIVAKMLAKKPEDRYQTPAELLGDLEHPERVRPPVSEGERLAVLADLAGEVGRASGRAAAKKDVEEAEKRKPASPVLRRPPGAKSAAATDEASGLLPSWWPWVLAGLAVLFAAVVVLTQLDNEKPSTKKDSTPEKRQPR